MATLTRKKLLAERKKRRRGRIMWRVIILLVVFGGTSIVLGAYLFSSKFRVSQVIVQGNKRAAEGDIREYIENFLGNKKYLVIPSDKLWMVSQDALAAGLKASFPVVKDVVVTKKYPETLRIDFTEYDAWGVLCHGSPEECFWIDQQGSAFDYAPGFSGTIVPKIRDERSRSFKLGEQQLSQGMMKLITFFNQKAVSDNNLQSVQFTIAQKDQTLRVRTRAGWELLLLESTDPEQAYKNLTIALDQDIKENVANLEYIDLRFGSRIFYKLKGAD